MLSFLTRIAAAGARKDRRAFLLEMLPKHGVGAEIGVWKGDFSDRIISVTAPKKLYLIDPWRFQIEFPDRMYGGKVAVDQAAMDAIYASVAARLGTLPNVEIIRALSSDAAAAVPDGSLDWVYIDGNHEYEYVRQDLDLFAAKVRPGGLITGDDYEWGQESGFPVRRAVDEFVAAGHAQAALIKNDQFVLRKPGGS